jgi:hypothetical protein
MIACFFVGYRSSLAHTSFKHGRCYHRTIAYSPLVANDNFALIKGKAG